MTTNGSWTSDFRKKMSLNIEQIKIVRTEVEKIAGRGAKVRVLVEHVFGFMENSMNRIFLRTIGMKRAKCAIGLANLVYNLCRYTQLIRLGRIQTA